ncbi:MAG TPA: DUF4349 domain-containing protein [Terriglobales bacterium]|nr:DUF4349 domain-containing protein [Terriglobales bacterium]
MNPQLGFAANRQFWAGVAATIAVGFLLAIGVPNLMRSRISTYEAKHVAAPTRDRMVTALGGGSGGSDQVQTTGYVSSLGYDNDRKMTRNASMYLIVKSPRETSDKIRQLAEAAGGFLVTSETYGGESASSASLTVRVPVDKFEQFRTQISKLGVRVESEKLEAQDVTKQYVDLSARLRNLRAQEAQYLGILKQAQTVKDTVEVSDKLNEVREQIDQQQAEFDALSKQVETVAITISLRAEADAKVLGLHWRPLYQLKVAARDGLDGIGDYASAMAFLVFFIPAVLLWLTTILIGAAIGWRILHWAWRALFVPRTKTA